MYLDRNVREKKLQMYLPQEMKRCLIIFTTQKQLPEMFCKKAVFKNFAISTGYYNPQCIKNEEKCFLLHLKSSFCSQDFKVFVLTFCSCIKAA